MKNYFSRRKFKYAHVQEKMLKKKEFKKIKTKFIGYVPYSFNSSSNFDFELSIDKGAKLFQSNSNERNFILIREHVPGMLFLVREVKFLDRINYIKYFYEKIIEYVFNYTFIDLFLLCLIPVLISFRQGLSPILLFIVPSLIIVSIIKTAVFIALNFVYKSDPKKYFSCLIKAPFSFKTSLFLNRRFFIIKTEPNESYIL